MIFELKMFIHPESESIWWFENISFWNN